MNRKQLQEYVSTLTQLGLVVLKHEYSTSPATESDMDNFLTAGDKEWPYTNDTSLVFKHPELNFLVRVIVKSSDLNQIKRYTVYQMGQGSLSFERQVRFTKAETLKQKAEESITALQDTIVAQKKLQNIKDAAAEKAIANIKRVFGTEATVTPLYDNHELKFEYRATTSYLKPERVERDDEYPSVTVDLGGKRRVTLSQYKQLLDLQATF